MSEDIQFKHKSVLLEEVIEELDLKPDGIYVDGTLGGAGHSSEMLRRAEIKKLIGIDQDPDAIKAASKKLGPFTEKQQFCVTIVEKQQRKCVSWQRNNLRRSQSACWI